MSDKNKSSKSKKLKNTEKSAKKDTVKPVTEEKKVKKNTFKYYYDNDPKFREKHKKYMNEHVECTCGQKVVRHYMTRHKKTLKHELFLLKKNS